MPVKFNYTTDNDKYAQCYRLLELLRIDFNESNITITQHDNLSNEVVTELLKLRGDIKNDNSINTSLSDVTL